MESTHPFSVSFAPCFQAVLCRSQLFFRMFLDKLFQICADRFIMKQKRRCFSPFLLSPSSRRAWIEICCGRPPAIRHTVALLAEGVDRNQQRGNVRRSQQRSPSSRRAWIEISFGGSGIQPITSPSSRRAWIEMLIEIKFERISSQSPSSRRAWIEISVQRLQHSRRRSPSSRRAWIEIVFLPGFIEPDMSPSSRRAWIEIVDELAARLGKKSPSSRRAWIEIGRSGSRHSCGAGRPPRGGRG